MGATLRFAPRSETSRERRPGGSSRWLGGEMPQLASAVRGYHGVASN